MDQVTSQLWVGGHGDLGQLHTLPPGTAILNVAHDLWPLIDVPIRYAQVGLQNRVNHPMLYVSAITQLTGLIAEKFNVLCICHSGKHRAPAVVAAYLRSVGDMPTFADALDLVGSRRKAMVRPKIYEHHGSLAWISDNLARIRCEEFGPRQIKE